MPKPSFTKEEQVKFLSEKWHLDPDRVRQMLRDFYSMITDSLSRKERVYLDNVGTLHVQVKNRSLKLLPGQENKQVIPAHLKVKFEQSETLIENLNPSFAEEIKVADWE